MLLKILGFSYLLMIQTCLIRESSTFEPSFYSHKTKLAGVRYEIAISIDSGIAVWASGPYKWRVDRFMNI